MHYCNAENLLAVSDLKAIEISVPCLLSLVLWLLCADPKSCRICL